MENEQDKSQQEEINNPEQFQVGRTPQQEEENDQQESYSPEETKFADGKGTQLNEELSEETDGQEKLAKKTDGTFEDQDFGKDEGLQPEVNDI